MCLLSPSGKVERRPGGAELTVLHGTLKFEECETAPTKRGLPRSISFVCVRNDVLRVLIPR